MGIFQRFKDIMSANVNDLLDKCEDPAKMVEEELRKATMDLAQVRKETKQVMADETTAKERYDRAQADVVAEHNKALAAVRSGDEHAAEIFLQKEKEKQQIADTAKANYEVARDNAEKMRKMHNKLNADIEKLKARKDNIKATVSMATATERVNNMRTPNRDVSGNLDKWEERARRQLAEANAGLALNEEPVSEYDALNAQYSGGGSDVSDMMAALKAEAGVN